MVLIFAFFVLDKGLGIVSSWEQHRATVAEQKVAEDKAKNDIELAVAKQKLSDYQEAISQTEKVNARLEQGIVARDTLLSAQQKKDVAMPPSQLATRWQEFVGEDGIVPVASGYNVSNDVAIATVQNLEQVPVLKADLADEQSKTAALQKDVTSANDLIGQGKLVVNGLQLQLTDQSKACTAQINAVKAQARKGKLKAFGIGYGLGVLTGLVAHAFGF